MTLTLKVTWPVEDEMDVSIQMDCAEIRFIHPTYATRNGNDIVIRNVFGENNRVRDVDRYRIRCQDGSQLRLDPHGDDQGLVEGSNYRDIWPQENFTGDTLVVILESPHKDEYRNNCIDSPIAPAQNNRNNRRIIGTGIGIQEHLLDVIGLCPNLRCKLSGRETRVILCNPIQFQTSLVAVICSPKWETIRNKVWRTLWDMPRIKDEFRVRLASYSPNYIINACTSSLQQHISSSLGHDCFSNATKHEAYHPSYWKTGKRLHSIP